MATSPTTIAGDRPAPGTCDPVSRDLLRAAAAPLGGHRGRRRQDEVLMSVLQPEWSAGTLDL